MCVALGARLTRQLAKLDDDALGLLHSLTSLRSLDISRAGLDGRALSDAAVIKLLEHVGDGLETLVLNDNERLTEATILEGIRPYCRRSLRHLGIAGLTEVKGVGVAGLFVDWKAKADEDVAAGQEAPASLTTLNAHRCWDIDDAGVEAIIAHSGSTLRSLDLNSCDQITSAGLAHLTRATDLQILDLSMIRATDDFVLKDLLDRLPALQRIAVFGCNRVTDACPRRAGCVIAGQESLRV